MPCHVGCGEAGARSKLQCTFVAVGNKIDLAVTMQLEHSNVSLSKRDKIENGSNAPTILALPPCQHLYEKGTHVLLFYIGKQTLLCP